MATPIQITFVAKPLHRLNGTLKQDFNHCMAGILNAEPSCSLNAMAAATSDRLNNSPAIMLQRLDGRTSSIIYTSNKKLGATLRSLQVRLASNFASGGRTQVYIYKFDFASSIESHDLITHRLI